MAGVAETRVAGTRNPKIRKCYTVDLGIRPNQLNGGVTYEFVLTVDSESGISTSKASVVVNSPPNAGQFSWTISLFIYLFF